MSHSKIQNSVVTPLHDYDRSADMDESESVTSIAGSALHFAAAKGNVKECNALLDSGADVSARAKYGYTPLHEAARRGRAEACILLLDRGADVNAQNVWNSKPPNAAVCSHHARVCRILLERGVDVGIRSHGTTPMELSEDVDVCLALWPYHVARGMSADHVRPDLLPIISSSV